MKREAAMTKSALELFREGLDTIQIAEHLGGVSKGWSEARVYNAMRKERNVPKVLEIVKFAGHDPSERALEAAR
jgi:hypothetical protein